MAGEPGRSCPLGYRTSASDIRRAPLVVAETAYVIGGLYGNHCALGAIQAMAREEARAGLPAPTLIFNGDFNWFNADLRRFRDINTSVMTHPAVQGNVELELATPSPGAGCGCAYPDWVASTTVDWSNRIMDRLQRVGRHAPEILSRLAELPKHLRLEVGGLAIGVLHGDPDAVAGWGLAMENMPPPGESSEPLTQWFMDAEVDVLACTHTCIAYMQDVPLAGSMALVANNGAAGMPNFRGDRRGVITRIGRYPSPGVRLYGTRRGDVHIEAVAVEWDMNAWDDWFGVHWPAGSPAARSYGRRMLRGPGHGPDRARRGALIVP